MYGTGQASHGFLQETSVEGTWKCKLRRELSWDERGSLPGTIQNPTFVTHSLLVITITKAIINLKVVSILHQLLSPNSNCNEYLFKSRNNSSPAF